MEIFGVPSNKKRNKHAWISGEKETWQAIFFFGADVQRGNLLMWVMEKKRRKELSLSNGKKEASRA